MEKTNPLLQGLIAELKQKSYEQKSKLWRSLAENLEKKKRIVNLYKINKYAREGETIVVPGKVLSVGELDRNIIVAAYSFSDTAKEKINKKGKAITINELMKQDPKGKKIRIMG